MTNGVDADRTNLQIWPCAAGNPNQICDFKVAIYNMMATTIMFTLYMKN